jgi:hypothetical protein
MNLPVIFASVSAGLLIVAVGSTYLEPATPNTVLSQASRAAQFDPLPIAERERHTSLFRRG